MLQAIELETIIAPDGKLPEAFREAFGRKARVIVLLPEEVASQPEKKGPSERLMELAGKIDAFKNIEDPVAFQRQLRDEWTREWDK